MYFNELTLQMKHTKKLYRYKLPMMEFDEEFEKEQACCQAHYLLFQQ